MKCTYDAYGNIEMSGKDNSFKEFMIVRKGRSVKVKAKNKRSAIKKLNKGFYIDEYA